MCVRSNFCVQASDSLPLDELTVKVEKSAEVSEANKRTSVLTVGAVVSNATITGNRPAPLNLATVSGTRLPAPRPVELPTAHDIIPSPSPPDSTDSSYHSSFEVDLESGRSPRMREVSRDNAELVSSARRSQTVPPIPTEDAAVVPPSHSLPPLSSLQEVQGPSSTLDQPDLLTDSTPVMASQPIEPYSSTSMHSMHPVPQVELPIMAVVNTPSETNAAELVAAQPVTDNDGLDSDTTVRLVGGGGIVGIAPAVENETPRTDDTDVASINSATSESEIQKGDKSHKKTKSGLASLKKLGHLGGMRKRDSNNNIKVTVSPPPTVV